jgi:hypothetical protein
MKNKIYVALATAALGVGMASAAQAAATIVILNNNAAGVGFNDPAPRAPIGGNPGTTLGQQRLNAFQHAAEIWGSTITSPVTIVIDAAFVAQACTATGATLGSAGSTLRIVGLDNGRPDTIYGSALSDKIDGIDVAGALGLPNFPDIQARFNINLGTANCLPASPWYLGLDGNHGAGIDLVAVLLHEFGHGLGFQTFTSGLTGAQSAIGGVGYPSIWDYNIQDNSTGLNWTQMTNAQRQASAINTGRLVWTGQNVTNASSLLSGFPVVDVSGPAAGAAAKMYDVGRASFGARLTATGVRGDIMPVSVDTVNGDGCLPFNAANTLAVNGNIALMSRGVCGFVIKVKNAQNAGAIGVIIQDNVAGSPAPDLGGTDVTITIPAVRVTLADGATIRAALTKRSRTKSGVIANLTTDPARIAGLNGGFVQLYAPNPFVQGSSVSHFDVTTYPNMLMEPSINGDLTHHLIPPDDMTFTLLTDIGW